MKLTHYYTRSDSYYLDKFKFVFTLKDLLNSYLFFVNFWSIMYEIYITEKQEVPKLLKLQKYYIFLIIFFYYKYSTIKFYYNILQIFYYK